jgi:hypothetical protein
MKAMAMADMSGMKMAFAPQVGAGLRCGFGGKTPDTSHASRWRSRAAHWQHAPDDRLYPP